MHLTSHITHSNGYAPCIAYYRSNGVDQLFRKLKPKLNPPNAHRSPIKICEKWHTHNVQFPFMPNAFRILKPIQKSSKRVWVFHNTGANAFAKNQMRLAYEDKRDLYCMYYRRIILDLLNILRPPFCTLTTHCWLNWIDEHDWGGWGWLEGVGKDLIPNFAIIGNGNGQGRQL